MDFIAKILLDLPRHFETLLLDSEDSFGELRIALVSSLIEFLCYKTLFCRSNVSSSSCGLLILYLDVQILKFTCLDLLVECLVCVFNGGTVKLVFQLQWHRKLLPKSMKEQILFLFYI